jgi:methylamine---glutamate N-methyltransferase subunit B
MKTINARTKDLREVNARLKQALNGKTVILKEAAKLHGLCAGFQHGEVLIEGDAGDYLSVLNDGATVQVTQNVGNYVGDNMTKGLIVVQGSAGFGAGQYCYGGTLVIHGNAGDFTATMNKGATIIVGGNVGDEVGTYMLKGDMVVIGNAGKNFANYLIRGSVYIGGEWESLGHNTRVETLTEADRTKLRGYFEAYGIHAEPAGFKKIVAASEKPFYN